MKEIKLTIPEGCKTVTVKVDGEQVITEFGPEEKKFEPEDGEIVFATKKGICEHHFIFPYGHMKDANINDVLADIRLNINMVEWLCTVERPATEKEKKMFHNALKEKGLRWNAEEKKVEKLPRWRAEENKGYYYIGIDAEVEDDTECGHISNDACYSVGNYFKTFEAAECVAKQIREILKNSKSE